MAIGGGRWLELTVQGTIDEHTKAFYPVDKDSPCETTERKQKKARSAVNVKHHYGVPQIEPTGFRSGRVLEIRASVPSTFTILLPAATSQSSQDVLPGEAAAVPQRDNVRTFAKINAVDQNDDDEEDEDDANDDYEDEDEDEDDVGSVRFSLSQPFRPAHFGFENRPPNPAKVRADCASPPAEGIYETAGPSFTRSNAEDFQPLYRSYPVL
ncbi:hypothetical protein HZH68_013326 [Vespula germanica]|uniref:Uncharacterized protein n=1 Tax=Vespula germanica TaxID=30212 RepID=A0A834MWG7_VESGE|nr:hypothetical protein HZH68_013326 [Vespula germanica]